jgi:hypothetical protein
MRVLGVRHEAKLRDHIRDTSRDGFVLSWWDSQLHGVCFDSYRHPSAALAKRIGAFATDPRMSAVRFVHRRRPHWSGCSGTATR